MTTTQQPDEIRDAVREAYATRARHVAASETPTANARDRFYADAAEALPDTLVSYGCGNPTAIAGLQPGETVLDLGSGAGLDCFLSAQQVGPSGRVIGLDMTDEMLTLAEANREKLGGVPNVEFRKGVIEAMPVEYATVDVIISNCVVNLSPDKDAVFRESFRVLRPGGRVHISDVVLVREISDAERGDLDLWAGCKSGALHTADYERRLAAAGFEGVDIALEPGAADGPAWRSALISARRPGGAAGSAPRPRVAQKPVIEFLAPAGLAVDACCDSKATCCGDDSDCC